jgi:hypothetical protein
VAQGYPPRRPPAGPGGPGSGGRHGYPEQSGEPGRGHPAGPGPRGGGASGRHGYPGEPDTAGPGGYPPQPGPAGPGGYPDDWGEPGAGGGRGYRDEPQEPARRRHPEERRRPSRPERAPRPRPDAFDDDEEMTPWAGPGIYPVGPGQRQLRPPRERSDDQQADGEETGREAVPERTAGRGRGGRAAATRARKSRRRLVVGGVAVVVAAAVAVLGVLGKLPFQGSTAKSPNDGFVTTYQPGDFHSVPDACSAISAAMLSQYLPGKVAQVSQPLGSAAQSQCTWTLDTRPQFRVLTVTSQAYAPSLLSTGNGSATSGAKDAYNSQLHQLRDPPKSSKGTPAQIGGAVGLGNSAFTATQELHLGGGVSDDEVTVVARDRNVVIVVTLQGQESGGGFGPVPEATLRAGALAAAHEVLAALR